MRLREQNQRYTLTVKTSAPAEQAVLTERREFQARIPAARARAFLETRSLPLSALLQSLDAHTQALTRLLEDCEVDRDLCYLGYFENTRVTLPLILDTAAGRQDVVLEFDTSVFPGQAPSYEIEVELPTREAAHGIRPALLQLLRAAGIDWWVTRNKAARFFDALDAAAGISARPPPVR